MYNLFFKRFFDFLVALLLLPVILPVLFLAALLIFINSPGNPIFKQLRVGRGGKVFPLYKLRSMVVESKQKSKDYKTAQNDVRVTGVGRFLRKTSLDELPQIFNVFFGQMSFVGPRPDVMEMKSLYSPQDWQERCSVRPGITGLAQATKRSVATAEERLSLDLEYVRKLSFFLDLKVSLMTVGRLLKLKGTN